MGKYNLAVLLTIHDSIDTVRDQIQNIKKFNDNVFIVINDGTEQDNSELNEENVVFLPRQTKSFAWGKTITPLHIEMKKYLLEKEIQADIILMLASNQFFIKSGFYNLAMKYDFGYGNRPHDSSHSKIGGKDELKNEIGFKHFTKQSNHDSMFFKYTIFMHMMDFFSVYEGNAEGHHEEEFFYIAFLEKFYGLDNAIKFEDYSYWCVNWNLNGSMTVPELEDCLNKDFYFIKRVSKDSNDPVRIMLKEI